MPLESFDSVEEPSEFDNAFSDATAFTDIWSDLFQFQNEIPTPDLSVLLTQDFFTATASAPLDPEVPSIDTQRTL